MGTILIVFPNGNEEFSQFKRQMDSKNVRAENSVLLLKESFSQYII